MQNIGKYLAAAQTADLSHLDCGQIGFLKQMYIVLFWVLLWYILKVSQLI